MLIIKNLQILLTIMKNQNTLRVWKLFFKKTLLKLTAFLGKLILVKECIPPILGELSPVSPVFRNCLPRGRGISTEIFQWEALLKKQPTHYTPEDVTFCT